MKQEKQKNHKSGFTLLELLVVVVIIGILAAIALPQYKMAVAKSQYTTLKNMTKSIAESIQRFYLANDAYPTSYQDLDLDFNIKHSHDGQNFDFSFKDSSIGYCHVWGDSAEQMACYKNIFTKQMGYYLYLKNIRQQRCITWEMDENHVTNRVCQAETGKQSGTDGCDGDCKTYRY